VNVTAVPEQIAPVGLATTLTAGVTVGFTIIVIPLDVAVAVDGHVALDVIVQVTTSPFASVVLEYVVPPVPTLLPFTCHWYVGVVPPFVGVTVNATEVPLQIAPVGLAATLTEGTTTGFTTIVMALDVAIVGTAHGELDVTIQVIICPLVNALEV